MLSGCIKINHNLGFFDNFYRTGAEEIRDLIEEVEITQIAIFSDNRTLEMISLVILKRYLAANHSSGFAVERKKDLPILEVQLINDGRDRIILPPSFEMEIAISENTPFITVHKET